MAEIEIERRPRRSGWTWFALLLVLAGVLVGAWLIMGGGDGVETDTAPAAETTGVPEPLTDPGTPIELEPEGDVEVPGETGGEGGVEGGVQPTTPPGSGAGSHI